MRQWRIQHFPPLLPWSPPLKNFCLQRPLNNRLLTVCCESGPEPGEELTPMSASMTPTVTFLCFPHKSYSNLTGNFIWFCWFHLKFYTRPPDGALSNSSSETCPRILVSYHCRSLNSFNTYWFTSFYMTGKRTRVAEFLLVRSLQTRNKKVNVTKYVKDLHRGL